MRGLRRTSRMKQPRKGFLKYCGNVNPLPTYLLAYCSNGIPNITQTPRQLGIIRRRIWRRRWATTFGETILDWGTQL